MSAAEGAFFQNDDDLVLVAARHPNPGPYRNAAVLTGHGDVETRLERALDCFGGRRRAFVLWVRSDGECGPALAEIAAARDWRPLEGEGLPQLGRVGPPDPVEPGDGVTLTWATDERMRRDFVQVNSDAWGMEGAPFETAVRILFEPGLLDDPTGVTFAAIAYLDGKPASTAVAVVHPEGVVGAYWGATAPWALGHRLYDLTMRAACRGAFSAFPTARHAVCQNSPGAAKTIARMGFEEVGRWMRYLVPTPPA
jgi:hypothetical protein